MCQSLLSYRHVGCLVALSHAASTGEPLKVCYLMIIAPALHWKMGIFLPPCHTECEGSVSMLCPLHPREEQGHSGERLVVSLVEAQKQGSNLCAGQEGPGLAEAMAFV